MELALSVIWVVLESSKNLIWVIIFEDTFTRVVSKISNSCPEIELFILDWPGVGPMRQFVLKWIRTVVGPPPAYQEPWQPRPPPLGVASACSLTYFWGGRISEARWGHLHPHRLSNLGLLNSLRKQCKPVHDLDLALPACWHNFLLDWVYIRVFLKRHFEKK